MRRFFIDQLADNQVQVKLGREESRHCLRVLRLKRGDMVELLDGTGVLYRAVIEDDSGREVVVSLQERVVPEAEPGSRLWVFQGDLKGGKMDELVQRCTELGVTHFFAVSCDRSQGRLSKERWDRKQERWQGIVRSACKQSGRLRAMQLGGERAFSDLLVEPPFPEEAVKILCWEQEQDFGLARFPWPPPPREVCLMVGPEGGFTGAEVALARQHGWLTAGLGRHILRAETATLTAVAIIQHLLGELD